MTTESLSIHTSKDSNSVNKLPNTKNNNNNNEIHCIFKGLLDCLVISRLLVYLGRGQTALGKGKRSSLSILVCMQQAAKQQSYSS